MNDYDKLIKQLIKDKSWLEQGHLETEFGIAEHIKQAVDTIGELQAKMQPVVRGEWQSWTQDRPPCKWYSCDYCGFHALSESNYCPNCGADMRGVDNG